MEYWKQSHLNPKTPINKDTNDKDSNKLLAVVTIFHEKVILFAARLILLDNDVENAGENPEISA